MHSKGCCRDTLLIKQLLGEAEGVSSNWLLCRFPAKTVSLKSKCHQSSAGKQPLRNLRVGRMRWFITAVIPLVLGFICGGGVVHREPLPVLFWTGTLAPGVGIWGKFHLLLRQRLCQHPPWFPETLQGLHNLAPFCKPTTHLNQKSLFTASSVFAPYLQGLGEDVGFAEGI